MNRLQEVINKNKIKKIQKIQKIGLARLKLELTNQNSEGVITVLS